MSKNNWHVSIYFLLFAISFCCNAQGNCLKKPHQRHYALELVRLLARQDVVSHETFNQLEIDTIRSELNIICQKKDVPGSRVTAIFRLIGRGQYFFKRYKKYGIRMNERVDYGLIARKILHAKNFEENDYEYIRLNFLILIFDHMDDLNMIDFNIYGTTELLTTEKIVHLVLTRAYPLDWLELQMTTISTSKYFDVKRKEFLGLYYQLLSLMTTVFKDNMVIFDNLKSLR